MILKTKDRKIQIEIKSKKANEFEEMVCEEDESLLSILPQKSMGRGSFGFMAKMINFFSVEKEKLPIDKGEDDESYDTYDFIDDWVIENKKSVTDLYVLFLKEFDVNGIISRGVGIKMGELIVQSMNQMISGMEEEMKKEK